MSSDPLGLAAGVNTFGYVGGNSLRNSYRLELQSYRFFNLATFSSAKSIITYTQIYLILLL